ncbi:MAG: O-antigen ligase family protein [bacterium]|nr:O-antigen ligase family protein [bacterium]
MRFLLLVIITLLPTYLIRFHIGPFPTTLLEILLLSTFLYWCGKKVHGHVLRRGDTRRGSPIEPQHSDRGRRMRSDGGVAWQDPEPWQKHPLFYPTLLFLLSSTISIFIAPDLRAALGLWRAYIIEPILFFLMMTDTLNHSPRSGSGQAGWPTVWRDVTIALSLSALGVALPAIYQKFNPIGIPNIHWAAAETRRVVSWYGFPNALGLYLAPIIVLLVGWIFSKKEKVVGDARRGSPIEPQHPPAGGDAVGWGCRAVGPQTLAIIATAASLLAILFARSEGAIASLLIVGFVAGMFSSRTRLWVSVITLVFVIATFTNTPWRDYVYEQAAFHGDSGKVRIQQWKETIKMLRDHPIFGAGLSGYQKTVAPYHKQKHIEIYQYPHNIVLNFWSELGLLGVIAFLWLVILFFRKALSPPFRGGARGGAIIISAISVILIHGLVDVPYFKNDLAIFFWLLLALSTIDRTTQSTLS